MSKRTQPRKPTNAFDRIRIPMSTRPPKIEVPATVYRRWPKHKVRPDAA